MKKHKNRGLILSFTIMAIVFSVFSFHDVMAEDDAETICKQKLANTKFSWAYKKKKLSADQKYITIYVESLDGKQYDFDIDVDYTIGNGTDSYELKNQKTGTGIVIPTKYNGDSNVVMNIKATLVSSLEVTENEIKYDCSRNFVLETSYRFEDNRTDTVYNPSVNGICARYKSGSLTNADLGLDTKFSALNDKGSLSYAKVSSVNVNGTNGATLLDNLFPYCTRNEVDSVYSDQQVLNQLYNAASIVINRSGLQKVPLPAASSEGFLPVDPKNKIILACDAFANTTSGTSPRYSNVRKFYSTFTETSDKMEFHYKPNKTTTSEKPVCSMECVEQVTVSYGPPVAVKAGLCFEYEVEIRSKVTCSSEVLVEPPEIKDYKVCTPTAHCNNSNSYYFDQAGPNEEFESCITSCDGGKYSQSCINKCYNKVYGNKNKNSSTKQSLSLVDSSVQKMASSTPNWCKTNYIIAGNTSKNKCSQPATYSKCLSTGKYTDTNIARATEVYNAYRSAGYYGGYYYRNNGKIAWRSYDDFKGIKELADGTTIKTADGCYWNNYGRYYFSNKDKAIRTVLNDGQILLNYQDGGDALLYWSYKPVDGFKGSTKCDDECHWETSCDGYLNEVAPKNSGTDSIGDGQYNSAYDAYYHDLETYNNLLARCSSKAACSSTTAKYTMTVNNSTGEIKTCKVGEGKSDSGTSTCKSWIEDSNKKTSITTDSKNNIITKEVSGVCANTPTKDKDDYKTIISFPGSYVNNKNGTVKFKIPDNEKDFYTYKNGEYCVPLNAKDVNVNWWIWDQVNKRSEETKKYVNTVKEQDTTTTTYNKYKGEYNISAKIENFGKLDWNIDLSCFYAVSNSSNPSNPGDGYDDSSTDTDTNEKTDLPNFDTKAAALDELFPAKDTSANVTGTSTTTELQDKTKVTKLNYTSKESTATKLAGSTTRVVGYNWSCEATNLKIKEYPITPTALISKIQKEGDSVYSDSSERDYHIHLTKANISNIRKAMSKLKNPYTNYGSSKHTNNVNDITFYNSEFLENSSYVSTFSEPSSKLCNNMKNGQCDLLNDYVQAESFCVRLINERG